MFSDDNTFSIHIPLPAGTQVVIRVDYHDSSGEVASLAGTVGVRLKF